MEFVEKIIYNENKYEKKITEDMLTLKYKIIELSIVENTDKKIAILKDLFKSVNLSMKIVLSIKYSFILIGCLLLLLIGLN